MVLNKKERETAPGTLKRSPDKAQDMYMHTLESAEQVYGDGEAPHRIALALLETFIREGGRPLGTQGRAGPSDEQDAKRGVEASSSTPPDRGGVNANATKATCSMSRSVSTFLVGRG